MIPWPPVVYFRYEILGMEPNRSADGNMCVGGVGADELRIHGEMSTHSYSEILTHAVQPWNPKGSPDRHLVC